MAPHSSTLAWRSTWTEEPGRLQSMGSLSVGPDWTTSLSLFTFMHWKRKWQPTPVFLPGESQGRRSLVGCRLQGLTELDTTEATQQQQQQQSILNHSSTEVFFEDTDRFLNGFFKDFCAPAFLYVKRENNLEFWFQRNVDQKTMNREISHLQEFYVNSNSTEDGAFFNPFRVIQTPTGDSVFFRRDISFYEIIKFIYPANVY